MNVLPGPKIFWDKVNILGPEDCWLWTASITGSGYGQFWSETGGKRRRWNTHRLLATWLWGELPDDKDVSHVCEDRYPVGDHRARLCLNPAHLKLVSHAENMSNIKITARGRSVITPEIEARLIELRSEGYQIRDIAKRLGVSKCSLHGYLRKNKLTCKGKGRVRGRRLLSGNTVGTSLTVLTHPP